MRYVSIAGIFRECVEELSKELLPELQEQNSLITGVHFRHGRLIEISETLKELQSGRTTPATKWPMVALIRDFTEQRGQRDLYTTPRMTIAIATANDKPTMKAEEREKVTFIPILYPIYFKLLEKLHYHPRVSSMDIAMIPHTVVDHYYYSTAGESNGADPGSNIFNEFTDSIEIRDLELNIKPLNC